MSSQEPSECSELYEALRSYVVAALRLLSQRCAEGPPVVVPFIDEWKRDTDGLFRLHDYSEGYWVHCISSNREALHSLDECQHLLAVLRRTPHIAGQMDQLIGTAEMGMQRVQAHDITDRLIWSLPQCTGGLEFNDEVFNELFHQLITDLKSPTCPFVVLMPLLGMTAQGLPIALGADIAIDRMTDEEIGHCLKLRMLPRVPLDFSARVAEVTSDVAVRIRCALPKHIGEDRTAGSHRTVQQAYDMAKGVLHALRVFKQGQISIPGVLNLGAGWPLQDSTRFSFANPGSKPWDNKYVLSAREARAFPDFWTHFRRATSKTILDHAVRRFSDASERERPDDRLIDLMIAAESLFLGDNGNPADRGELRYRLSLRAAYFIHSTDYSRLEVFEHMKRAYDGRSAIVHGGGEPNSSTLKSPKNVRMNLQAFSELTAHLMRIALKQSIDITTDSKGPLIDWDARIIRS